MPVEFSAISFNVVTLVIIALCVAAALYIVETMYVKFGAAAINSTHYPYSVTLSAYQLTGDEIMSLTVWYESQDDICKSIEPAVAVCKEMGVYGEIEIELMVEKNGEYLDHDELTIELSADGRLIGISDSD